MSIVPSIAAPRPVSHALARSHASERAPFARSLVSGHAARRACGWSLPPWLSLLLLCLGVFGPASGARAQPMGEVVVVPFGVPELTTPLNVTSLLEAELTNERVSLIPLHDARDRFTARSRPPLTASDSDLDVLAREARQAIEHVAFGRTAAAQKSVREVIARAEKTLESLNRETATARHILDACLSLVRGALQTGRRDLALEQATRCRRLVPDLVPDEANHPANVVGVLAEADNMLRRMRIGALEVRSTPESNCSVYLNGRHLGTTPFRLDRAAAGDYRVQVECSRSVGRVHVVQLGDQAVSLLVDTQFDRTVASDPRLLLRYPNRDRAREQAVAHAVQIGREIQADDVLLVGVQHDRAEIMRVHVGQQKLIARVSVPWTPRSGFSHALLEAAIVALSEGRLQGEPSLEQAASSPEPAVVVAPAASEPVATPQAEPAAPTKSLAQSTPDGTSKPATPSDDARESRLAEEREPARAAPVAEALSPPQRAARRERRLRIAGYTLVGVSAAAFLVGIAYDARTQQLLDRLANVGNDTAAVPAPSDDPSDPEGVAAASKLADLQSQYEHASHVRWIGMAGGAVGTVASALLVRPRGKPNWWGYALGAAGVGLVVGGVVELARDGECELKSRVEGAVGADGEAVFVCRRATDSAALGALLLSASAPLLSVPLLQWLKPTHVRTLALSSSASRGGMQLQLRGSY